MQIQEDETTAKLNPSRCGWKVGGRIIETSQSHKTELGISVCLIISRKYYTN